MLGISYKLRLLEPVLANHLAGDSNSAHSFKFVPGAVVRGAVIRAYKQNEMDAGEPKTRRLFFDGTTRFLHAYPYVEDSDKRALPMPLSWRKHKDDEITEKTTIITIYDFSQAFNKNGEQVVSTESFCIMPAELAYQVEMRYRLNVHTQRDALRGRSTEEHGAVYRYESLPKYTILSGVVLTENEPDANELKCLLEGSTIYLGKARSAGYGRARVESVEMLEEGWREIGKNFSTTNDFESAEDYSNELVDEFESGEANDDTEAEIETTPSTTNQFTLTFLSEAVVRDYNGQHTLDPLPALQRRLGLHQNATLWTLESDGDLVFRQAKIIGGFNRKWNLPLPQVAAIAAGSVFVINSTVPIAFANLKDLEAKGIGERRAEGYGRVAINWHTEAQLSYSKLEAKFVSDEGKDTSVSELGAAKEFAEKFLKRLLRSDLEKLLRDAVNKTRIKDGDTIPNSQLSRWHSIIRSAFAAETKAKGVERINQFRAKEEMKASVAWEKMRRTRLQSESVRLTDWIKELLAGNRLVALKKGLRVQELPKRSLGESVEVTVTDELADEFRLRLLDAVLKRKAKEQAAQRKR